MSSCHPLAAGDCSLLTGSTDESVNFFVARQPIFNSQGTVYGYELLFRSCLDNSFDRTEARPASSLVVSNRFFSTGAAKLLAGKKAFIRVAADMLVAGVPLLVSPELIVVEITETIQVDADLLAVCRSLKEKGYLLALDDYNGQPHLDPLLDFADIVKVDFGGLSGADRRRIAGEHRARKSKMLAEKVETQEEFDSARDAGYTYFQGLFFARPKLVRGPEVAGFKLNLRILAEAHRPDIDFDEIVKLIKQEISLAARLLRYINSAAFSFRGHIASLPQALALLGERAVRDWLSAAVLMNLAKNKPGELIIHAILRARFCELIARSANFSAGQQHTLFLIGMFSLLDAVVDRPLDQLLAELPLSSEVRGVLLGNAPQGDLWAEVFASVKAYEAADWSTLSASAGRLGISNHVIQPLYLESADWSAHVFQSASAASQ